MIDQLSSWLQLPIKYLLAILSNFIFSQTANLWKEPNNWCLVLLCDQNSFGRSKKVLVWPNWFGLDHNDLVRTKMKWSGPKWIGQGQMWFILVENHNFDLTNSFWSWPFHFLWSSSNQFGQTKTILDKPYLFWSHRRTRHYTTNSFPIHSKADKF